MKKFISVLLKFSNVIIAIGVGVFFIGLIFFYTFPFNVAEFKKVNVLNNVSAGQIVEYNLDFCRYVPKGTDIKVDRYLFAKDKTLTNPIELSGNPSLETLDGVIGCRTSDPIKIPVEISVPEGEYKLLIRADYCIEFFLFRRCIMVEQSSDFFKVNKPDIPSQLSLINEQIGILNQYAADNPEEFKSIGNAPTAKPNVPTPVQPNVTQPVTPQLQEPSPTTQPTQPMPQQNRNQVEVKSSIIDLSLGLPILKRIIGAN